MPDLPPDLKQPRPTPVLEAQPPASSGYAELHCKTNFSFLQGASHPDELALRAAELGYAALAVTDRNTLAGVVRAHSAAKELGLKLLIGAEITPIDAPPIVLWASDRASYARLSRLITVGRRSVEKGQFRVDWQTIAEYSEGLLAGVIARHDERSTREERAEVLRQLRRYRELFGDRAYLLAELHLEADDARRLAALAELAHRGRLPLVAAGDAHYHIRGRLAMADLLTAIRLGTTIEELGEHRFANGERHLQEPVALARRFAGHEYALARTLEVADRCHFSLDELRYEYPEELAPPGETASDYLARLVWAGAGKRYPQGVPEKVRSLVVHELQLISDLRYEAYFLTVHDLVRFARDRDILCQGRGSAANSAVCFCLEVTSVDPDRLDVLFERFISRERNEAPDIDIDFEHERREEVLQYLYDKYGRERAGMTAEVITYRMRSAVREVGKALGLSLDRIDRLSKSLEGYRVDEHLKNRCRDAGIAPDSLVGQRLLGLVEELVGFPRHLGQHVGGMVMTRGPLCELCPIENAAMEGRTVIEWDKNDLDDLGILKVDCLSLGMLTAIRKCFELIERHGGPKLALASIPEGDQEVYDMICRADTMGVFQIESRAQMSMLPRLRPRCFYDLVIEVAIVRPGPIQGNMVHPYLRRRAGEETPTYPNDEIHEVLKKTLGVPLFQEQAMRLAVTAAGFTPGEADQLRRAMGAWRKTGVIEQFRLKLLDGMLSRGLTREFAEQVFTQIRGFGEYGFPESHAASFALLVYVSCWLKHHYLAAFTASLVNSQPMGFYAPAQLVRNAREHGVPLLPMDVNHSNWDCALVGETARPVVQEPPSPSFAIRLGLRLIAGFSQSQALIIEQVRQAGGPFIGWDDFARRTGLSRAVLLRLAEADALGSLGLDRRRSLWQALGEEQRASDRPLFANVDEPLEPAPGLPVMPLEQEVLIDYHAAGLSLKAHPIEFARLELDRLGVVPAVDLARLPNGRPIRVAGLVLVRQRPGTARGITFVTIEDETAAANLIIRPEIWLRFYQAARTATALIAHGQLQSKDNVVHVLVNRLEDLTERLKTLRVAQEQRAQGLHSLAKLPSQSRDFQ